MPTRSPSADAIVAFVLAPVLLAQVAWVVGRMQHLPEARGPRHGIVGQGPVLRLLILGDSSGAGVGAETHETALSGRLLARLGAQNTVHWRVLARSGATTAKMLERVAKADLEAADVVVTALGVNDVKNGVGVQSWLDDTAALHAYLIGHLGARQVIMTGLPPMAAFPALPRPLSTVLGRRAARFECAFLAEQSDAVDAVTYLPINEVLQPGDMARDGFHPGPRAYEKWASKIVAAIATDRGTSAA